MNSYWLSRANSKAVEGPFPFERLEGLYRSCQINGNDDLCHVDAQDWTTVEKVMARHGIHVGPSPAESMRQMQQMAAQQELKKNDNVKNVAALMLGLCVLLSAIPVLGLLMWLFYGIIAFTCTVLAVVLMVRNAAGSGVVLLLITYVGTPLAMIVANTASLAILPLIISDSKSEAIEQMADNRINIKTLESEEVEIKKEPPEKDEFQWIARRAIQEHFRTKEVVVFQSVKEYETPQGFTVTLQFETITPQELKQKHVWIYSFNKDTGQILSVSKQEQ